MSKFIDLTGQKFGRLTVIKRAPNAKNGQTMYLCQCECGKYSTVTGVQLRSGHTKSCGCLRKDLLTTHNATHSRMYVLWWGIKQRCFNPKSNGYENYGGRGITICDEWRKDFQAFYDWAMANGYTDKLSIDRIDVNGNYEPSNCRWVDMKFQGNHRRNNRLIEHNGEILTVSEWSERTGIKVGTIYSRLDRGWGTAETLTTK